MPFARAMQNLLQENYDLFLVTIGCNTVSVYLPNGSLKIFYSHARDSFGMPQPHGTCAIAENAMLLYESLSMRNMITNLEDFPQRLFILDAEVDIVYTARQQGILSVPNKPVLVKLILQNTMVGKYYSIYL